MAALPTVEPSLVSFIVPAHNEAFEISRTLEALFAAARAVGRPFEIIVVNDASTDGTGELARGAGARTLDVQLRKISAVRNAGARDAKGRFLFFIDADTRISEAVLRAALGALDEGATGGGASVLFDDPVPFFSSLAIRIFSFLYMRLAGWAAGCFIFAQREAFETVGGFDETLYAAEEIVLSIALKRQGRFAVLRENVRTSARKLRMHSPLLIIPLAARFLIHGSDAFRRREGLAWWYDGRREK